MFPLSSRLSMVFIHDGGSDLSERVICDIITTKVLRFILEDFPGMIISVKNELTLMVDE